MVVQEAVVRVAEQDAVADVGGAVVAEPVVDVVGFGEGGWFVAVAPAAAAVAGGEGDALGGGEEALVSAEVEGLVVGGEGDGQGAAVADEPVEGGLGQGCGVALR
ncbi:hypothetical protein [Cryobacterium sp. PAMC25264]|uniref:hypothetical protein n=1 Tax=Cryobacterium sp. PAMC25264 TaxID=2861288 RepID=UPI001C62617A|nr:hypothetical protein [Cryobacterium sp. PAMC25264]QYF74226.1 hypothetical protein KY500_03075 [Cryobacterium sp. PAMC25264]